MINWDDYKYNDEICLRILNEGKVNQITVKLLEYGWHEHGRIRITAIVEIVKTDSPEEWHLGAKMELPIKTEGVIDFIMLEHLDSIPCFKSIKHGEIVALCDIN